MATSNITDGFLAEFGKLIELQKVAPNEHLQRLLSSLDAHNLTYIVDEIHPSKLLTHQANRGGLLLSPHNVHRNAKRIHATGADLKQLTHALCVELQPHGKVREEHIAKNSLLVHRSGGLLAPIHGGERYVTLGCGHTAAFCKQAHVGGITCEASMQLPNSDKIDLQKLCSNPAFHTMIMKGWKWQVVPAVVDELFPAFGRIAQRALNTQNHVSTEVGELETCMILGASIDDPGMQDIKEWKKLAVDNIASLCVPCAPYSPTLLEYVLTFGGGKGAPLIAFMDSVAKQFGCNVNLGGMYWDALTKATFASHLCR